MTVFKRKPRDSKFIDDPFPNIDPEEIGKVDDITLQRRINGFGAELRVLVLVGGQWYTALHEQCAGNLDVSLRRSK